MLYRGTGKEGVSIEDAGGTIFSGSPGKDDGGSANGLHQLPGQKPMTALHREW